MMRTTFFGLLLLALSTPVAGRGQVPPGLLTGQVFDADAGRPLPGAQVQLAGSGLGTLAGLDGRYRLDGIPPGIVSIEVQMLGYATKTVTGVVVTAGTVSTLDILLEPTALEIEGITVSAEQERGSVGRALNEQRAATGIVNAITAEEISRSPDGDAASAIKRVSGVSVQDGRYVVVRGLGERYTTTSLNGARMPSPEPERKVVPLDMFPSGLLQTITTSKTFTPDLPGDFTGGQVDIRTRTFPGRRQFSFSTATSLNSAVVGSTVLTSPTAGGEWLAAGADGRALPEDISIWGDFRPSPGQDDVNRIVGSFRNAWSTRTGQGRPGGSMSASLGGTDGLFGHSVGYLVSGTYSYSQSVKQDQHRAQALAQDGGEAVEVDRYDGTTGSRSVLVGGLLNLSTMWGSHTRFMLNGSYNRTSDDDARFESGFSENLGQAFQIDRLRYVEREVNSAQLGAEHQLGRDHRVDWSVTRSAVSRQEPDRSEIVYQVTTDPVTGDPLSTAWFSTANEGAVRTFGALDETSLEASLNYRLDFGALGRTHQVRLGTMARDTERDATNRAYSIGGSLDGDSRALDPEKIFDGRFSGPGQSVFRVTPLSQGGSYSAEDRLLAGYAMLQLRLAPRIELVGGVRVERSELSLDAASTVGEAVRVEPEYTDVLPSLALNLRLSDRQNVRLSASRTLSRPEYRELANVQYREILGGDNVLGNPNLRRTLVQNADLRWEFYPNPTEAFTVALFAKRFDDPIERVYLATSGTRIVSFANAESAENYGVELEARKRLGGFSRALDPLTAFANLTLMSSEIRIGGGASSRTADERPMVGQSPYVVNAGLTYAPGDARNSLTLLYNVAGRRISSAAEAPLPDVYEEARHLLDVSLRIGLGETVSAKLDLANLLDSPYESLQGSVVREYYRTGRTASFGLTWRPR
jgi:outer membrane receptor for ferrienterochelin and colicin